MIATTMKNGVKAKSAKAPPIQPYPVPGELQHYFTLPGRWEAFAAKAKARGHLAAVPLMPVHGNPTPVFYLSMQPRIIGIGGFVSWCGVLYVKDRETGLYRQSPIKDEAKQRTVVNGG